MEIYILNSLLEIIGVIDTFKSLIWTDRYNSPGDFELVGTPYDNYVPLLYQAAFFQIEESEHLMIPDVLNIHVDEEENLILKGKSLEFILDRRIIWDPTTLTGNFQNAISSLLNDNAINAVDATRNITQLEFLASTDPVITGLTIETQVFGETLDNAISRLCSEKKVGYKIILTELGKFRFELYSGINRSYDQSINPYVVFSPDFDNLISSDYIETTKFLKTIALVAGEKGVGNIPTLVTVSSPTGPGTGLSRREIYIEVTDVSRNVSGEIPLTEAEYIAKLEGRGLEELSKNSYIESFEGQVDTTMYNYGEDFFMGDVLQVNDAYGHQTKSRVIEMIYSKDESGTKKYPTFSVV